MKPAGQPPTQACCAVRKACSSSHFVKMFFYFSGISCQGSRNKRWEGVVGAKPAAASTVVHYQSNNQRNPSCYTTYGQGKTQLRSNVLVRAQFPHIGRLSFSERSGKKCLPKKSSENKAFENNTHIRVNFWTTVPICYQSLSLCYFEVQNLNNSVYAKALRNVENNTKRRRWGKPLN